MTWFLGTKICVYRLKGLSSHIKKELPRRNPETIKVPVITKAHRIPTSLRGREFQRRCHRDLCRHPERTRNEWKAHWVE